MVRRAASGTWAECCISHGAGSAADPPPAADPQSRKRLLPPGSRVRLFAEAATDRIDQYGRLLRYVVRVSGGMNVNIHLVAVGAAAPYFYKGRRGQYASRLGVLAKRARALKLGLWKACPHTLYDPTTASKRDAERRNAALAAHGVTNRSESRKRTVGAQVRESARER
jgi:nuclease-like protein